MIDIRDMVCYTSCMDANPRLKKRTLRLDINDCSLDTAIRELLAVKKNLRGFHVNTSETTVRVHEHFEPYSDTPLLRITLDYTSAMTAEELADEEASLARQKTCRLLAYNLLKEEFGEKS